MKQILKTSLFALLVVLSTTALAQKGKFAHIDSNELLAAMPERAELEKTLQSEYQTLEASLQQMSQEYQQKVAEYQELEASGGSELIMQTKVTEIQDLEGRIQQFQASAQDAIQQREVELMEGLYDIAKKAISEVASENGYTYVFDAAVLLHKPDGDDILPLVKKKMGITTAAPAAQ
ncbi:OmpH family outer membrane protein [Flavobacteriales bacterium]|jgi:outer membrane protein|nr:OmpH family outer membrane protein [Flavobacteriales bacterium]